MKSVPNDCTNQLSTESRTQHIPKVAVWTFTAFMAVLVPVYNHHYGPTNFLYFCDMALFLTLFAVLRQSSLAASTAAVGIMIPQLFWCVDFAFELSGTHLTHMTSYMLDERRSLFLRMLSLFHGWLPFFLLFLVKKLRYDPRALCTWTALAVGSCLISYFFLPPAGTLGLDVNTPINVNYVYGLNDAQPQTWLPAPAYLFCWVVGLFLLFSVPTHLTLKKLFKSA